MDCEGFERELVPFEGDLSTSFMDGEDFSLILIELFSLLGGDRSFTDGEESILLLSNLGYIGCLGGEEYV